MRLAAALAALVGLAAPASGQESARPKPLLRDFLGLNGHTVQYRPQLYRPVARLARDYHPVEWDLGADSDFATTFPFARNRVHWGSVYGSWVDAGIEVNASLMFANFPKERWKDPARDAHAYGKAFARAFGPSSGRKLVTSAEIGNEPGHYDDALYRTIFEAMARGLREGDPKIAVATCATIAGKSHEYAKSLDCVKGLEALYDVLNVHSYAELEPWPTWRRSFPEDPRLKDYLPHIRNVIAWRDRHAPGKPVWITEFGWDSSTKEPEKKGDFAKWVGVTDLQQAQYLVRSTLLFMTLDVARAYIYFFNDDDKPSLHASSGVTRNFQPKPSYHALVHLQKALGDFRLARVREDRPGERMVYEFAHETDAGRRVLAVWSPTGSGRTAEARIPLEGARLARAERMALAAGEVPAAAVAVQDGAAVVPVEESPIYLFLEP
jgi:hypothetical protein